MSKWQPRYISNLIASYSIQISLLESGLLYVRKGVKAMFDGSCVSIKEREFDPVSLLYTLFDKVVLRHEGIRGKNFHNQDVAILTKPLVSHLFRWSTGIKTWDTPSSLGGAIYLFCTEEKESVLEDLHVKTSVASICMEKVRHLENGKWIWTSRCISSQAYQHPILAPVGTLLSVANEITSSYGIRPIELQKIKSN